MAMIIKFQKGGKTEMLPTGYPGATCTAITSHYAKHMAGDQKKNVPTAEMYEDEQAQLNPGMTRTEEA